MKTLLTNYSFDPASRTVTFNNISFAQNRLLLIVNSSRGEIIYNFADPALGATAFANTNGDEISSQFWYGRSTTVTLSYDTTTHAATDVLTIFAEANNPNQQILPVESFSESIVPSENSGPNIAEQGLRVFAQTRGHVLGRVAILDTTPQILSEIGKFQGSWPSYLFFQNQSPQNMYLMPTSIEDAGGYLGITDDWPWILLAPGASLTYESAFIPAGGWRAKGETAGQRLVFHYTPVFYGG